MLTRRRELAVADTLTDEDDCIKISSTQLKIDEQTESSEQVCVIASNLHISFHSCFGWIAEASGLCVV